jgi:arginine-tRNA-protein transferase
MSDPSDQSAAATFSHWPAIPPPMSVRLTVLPEHPCPYLPGRVAQSRAIWTDRLAPEAYQHLMDSSFRRSGKLIYQPVCTGCRACQPLRVPLATFRPSKSQRRCLRRNSDMTLTVERPDPTPEKYDLYRRYLRDWHESPTEDSYDQFVSFLYGSPVRSLEFCHRDPDGRLLAVGICDIGPQSLSTVYFYFDPREARRGLGTLGALRELDFARERKLSYYYLGYWIDGCRSMEYKSELWPFEILWPDGAWRAGPVLEPYAPKRT